MGLTKGGGGGGGGEIVQVQGGHIVGSTGRKDRHSKVYTSRGPRDRRMRLSAHTAIQFYDVQDRLGFDRSTKAVDWLIKKAKSSIDKLVELPPWEPPNMNSLAAALPPPQPPEVSLANGKVESTEELGMAVGGGRGSESPDNGYDFSIHRETGQDPRRAAASCSSSLFPSQLDTVPFFATSSAMGASSSINFDDYGSSTNQDLGLSLHPFQVPSFGPQHEDHINQASIFPMTADYPKFMFNPPPPLAQPLFLGQTQSSAGFLQRGTLQSSFVPSFNSFEEFHPIESSSSSHHHHHHPSMLGSRFAPDGGFSGFCLQSQMQQDDEREGAISGRPTLSPLKKARPDSLSIVSCRIEEEEEEVGDSKCKGGRRF